MGNNLFSFIERWLKHSLFQGPALNTKHETRDERRETLNGKPDFRIKRHSDDKGNKHLSLFHIHPVVIAEFFNHFVFFNTRCNIYGNKVNDSQA